MGGSVEIYVKYAGEWHRLAHRVAETPGVVSCFYSGYDHVLPVDARRWIGVDGWFQPRLDRLAERGDALSASSAGRSAAR
ncbi:MAG: hypothetical protein IRY92_08835, partial [Dactylosporangium sp.]|nr:hypothetical protein [Dactylosporangium sp.]